MVPERLVVESVSRPEFAIEAVAVYDSYMIPILISLFVRDDSFAASRTAIVGNTSLPDGLGCLPAMIESTNSRI